MWNDKLENVASRMRKKYLGKSTIAIKKSKQLIIKLPKVRTIRPKQWELIKCWCGQCRTCKERNWARLRRIRLLEEREAQKQFWQECDKEVSLFCNYKVELAYITQVKTKGRLKTI